VRIPRKFPPYPQALAMRRIVISSGREESTMSLEQAIEKLTLALDANTAALSKGAVAAAPRGPGRPPKDTSAAAETAVVKSEFSREQMAAELNKVKEAKGAPAAKAIIKVVGKSDKMADISEALIDEVYAAAAAKLNEEEEM